MANGYKELLRNNIIHRDIKPANIFISDGVYTTTEKNIASLDICDLLSRLD